MNVIIGLSVVAAADKLAALKSFGRKLVTKPCADCGRGTILDAEAAQFAPDSRISCATCVDRALPAVAPDTWISASQALGPLRKIQFPPPIASYEPERLSAEEGLRKVARVGAPFEAIESLREQLAGAFSLSKATESALNWWSTLRPKRPLLALMGPTGCGKSTAAARAALEFARDWPWNTQAGGGSQREPLVWLNAEDVARLQVWQRDGARQYDEALNAKLLVIDDAGHEDIRPAIAAMTDLLMRRIDARRPTALSSNLRGKSLEMRYGKPVVDRFATRGVVPELGAQGSLRGRSKQPSREPGEDG